MNKKSLILCLAMMILPLLASAHDFEVDGIYYNITSSTKRTVEVTFKGQYYDSYYDEYSGSITIPATVTHNGTQYSVTSIRQNAFAYCSLASIAISGGVTSIGIGAFYGCSSLTSITIPESVTSIESGAFYKCSSLTAITIPEGVTSIGKEAFYQCSSLTDITLPEGVTSIGDGAFEGCSSLTSITIPESVTNIEEKVFYECSNLTSVTLPESITSIGSSAFYGCSSLNRVSIPESVTSIGSNAFYGCMFAFDNFVNKSVCNDNNHWGATIFDKEYDGALVKDNVVVDCRSNATVVTLPEGVTNIGNEAFYKCSSLTAITIPESVTSIGNNAFSYCSSLTSINIPKGVTNIGYSAFYGCSSLERVTINCANVGDWFEGNSSIKEVIFGEGVTSIVDRAFYECGSLTAVRISNIEAWCKISFGSSYSNPLYYAQNLYLNGVLVTELVIPEGVTSIGNYAFYNCSRLTSINIPEGVASIGSSAFLGCSSLERVTINCANVGNWFKGNSNIKEIILGEDVSSIGSSAFYGCSSLTTITIPESVTSIGKEAFYGCNSLTSINIPEGVTSIGSSAFSGCRDLTAVHASSIEAWCKISFGSSYSNPLYYAQNLYLNGELVTELVIPEGVTSIGNYAFYNCSSLTSINIPQNVTSIGGNAFYGCSSLERVTINCANVGNWFKGNSNIKEIILGEDVSSIESSAFYGCSSFTSITLPESVNSIGNEAFYGCSSLTAVHISNIEAWCKISFGSSYSNPLYYAQNLYLNGVLVTELVIPEGVTSIGNYVFYNCSSLTSINIPEGVASIGSSAFLGCSSLTVITIPEDVTSIGARAFCNCTELLSLHIGANVDSYGDNAFEGCTAIKELTVMGNVIPEVPSENLTSITLYSPIPLETKEFASKVYRNATLNIPDGSLTRYQNADVWKNFWYINEFDPKEGKDIFLTISQADNGCVKQHLVAGSVCTYTIEAAEGWKIHTVTFNGEDVTSQLTEEGTFTTPELQGDAVLNIAYEKIDDAIESTRAGAIKVQGHQGVISIKGATEGTNISLYTTDGTLVTRETAEGESTHLTVPTGQVYIVKVADTVVKIGM